MQNVLITGGAGFIGHALAKRLVDGGARVTLVDNFSRGRRDADLERLLENPAVTAVTADLLEPGALDGLGDDFDAVVHLAALLGVANVISRPYETLAKNAILTHEALKFAIRQRDLKSFVFASTSEVYAGTLFAGQLQFPTPETSLLALPDLSAPRTTYMLSKLYGEAMALQAQVPAVIIRPHNVYGPRMGVEHVVPELMKRMHQAEPGAELEIFSPTHMRTFCFIDDAVALIEGLMREPSSAGRAWNVGTQAPEWTIMQVAETVRGVVGADVRLTGAPDTAGSPSRRCPDMSATNAQTGITERVSLEDGAARTWAWYRQNVFS